MKILAIDLGKFKSKACVYQSPSNERGFHEVPTTPQSLHDLIVEHSPDRVVIEIGSQAGWVCDLTRALRIEIQVANPNHEGWRWKNTKRKTDRDDALKLAQLSAANQLPLVTVPPKRVRQWRSLIAYRHTLVRRRTAIKNNIRALLDSQGLKMPGGKRGWTQQSVKALELLSCPITDADNQELWRGELHLELRGLKQVEAFIAQVESKLEALAQEDKRVGQLQSIPGVGPRLSEVIVATIDDPKRFRNGKQVGAYAGLVPRLYESGTTHRQGRISGQGNKLLRALLVEVSWLMRRTNSWVRGIFDRVCRDSKTRRKIAVVAAARRLLVCCWAMLRDGTNWCDPLSGGKIPSTG